jgi:proteasome activator subunit 4
VRVIDALVNYGMLTRLKDSRWVIFAVYVTVCCVGSLEYQEWSSHVQAWKLESASIMEPPCNFIVPFHAQGKKRYAHLHLWILILLYGSLLNFLYFVSIRPRWALVDKANLHSTWRCSQSSYHRYRMNADVSPSVLMINLMNDLLDLSLHNYETVRS